MRQMMSWIRVLMTASLLAALSGQIGLGQAEDPLAKEVEQLKEQLNILREDQLKLRQELEAVRRFLSSLQTAAQQNRYKGKTVSIDDDPFRGKVDSKLTLIEFSDFQ